MKIDSSEIASLIKEQIKGFEEKLQTDAVGTVISVGDGIAICYGLDKAMLGELLVYTAFSALVNLFGVFLFRRGKLFFKFCVLLHFVVALRTSDRYGRAACIAGNVFGLVFLSVLAGREFVIIGFLFVDFNVKLVAEEGKTVTIAVADGVYLRDKLVFTGGKLLV